MMNKFTKDNLQRQGQYLLFGPDRKFVARFKHGGPFTMSKFRKELMMNHTPASYFREYNNGVAPLAILQNANPAWYNHIMTVFKLGA
jgi:hypothetical protein